jgi:hypothetical protein
MTTDLLCVWCGEAAPETGVHQECLFRMVVGSAAHQLGECSCYGGEREDPPHLTKREAAELALDVAQMLCGEEEDV